MKLAKGCPEGGKLWSYQTKSEKIETASGQESNRARFIA